MERFNHTLETVHVVVWLALLEGVHAVLRLVECQVSKREVNSNDRHDIEVVLDVEINEAVMTV